MLQRTQRLQKILLLKKQTHLRKLLHRQRKQQHQTRKQLHHLKKQLHQARNQKRNLADK